MENSQIATHNISENGQTMVVKVEIERSDSPISDYGDQQEYDTTNNYTNTDDYRPNNSAGYVLFSCNQCIYQCTDPEFLERHIQIVHSLDANISCSICDFKTNSLSILENHCVNIHNQKQMHKCPDCEFQTHSKDELLKHNAIHEEGKVYKCNVCDFKTSWSCSLNKHLIRHKMQKPFICTLCIYRCTNREKFLLHLQNRHNIDKLPPEYENVNVTPKKPKIPSKRCSQSKAEIFKLTKNLSINRSTYSNMNCDPANLVQVQMREFEQNGQTASTYEEGGKNKYVCDYCGEIFFTKHVIREHILNHMYNTPNIANNTSEKPYQIFDSKNITTYLCMYCFYPFLRQQDLLMHLKIHLTFNDKPCLLGNLSKHMLEFIEKSYSFTEDQSVHSCTFCEFKTKSSSNLEVHLRIHTGEKPFTCNLCDESFSRNNELKKHLKIHFPDDTKVFKCTECDYCCKDGNTLKRHIMTHSDERPFPCKLCSYKARIMGHLTRHMRTHVQPNDTPSGKAKKSKYRLLN